MSFIRNIIINKKGQPASKHNDVGSTTNALNNQMIEDIVWTYRKL